MKFATARCNPEHLKEWFGIEKFGGPGEYSANGLRFVIHSDRRAIDCPCRRLPKGYAEECRKAVYLSLFVEVYSV